MLASRAGDDSRHPKIKIRRMSSELEQLSLDSTRREMKNYLISIGSKQQEYQQLATITNLRQLVQKFAQTIQPSDHNDKMGIPISTESQLMYLRRRDLELSQKVKSLNEEIIKLMKALSARQEELTERQADIFGLKLKIEEKEKTIFQLKTQSGNYKIAQQEKETMPKQQGEVKIKVRQPKITRIDESKDQFKQESSIIPLDQPNKTSKNDNKGLNKIKIRDAGTAATKQQDNIGQGLQVSPEKRDLSPTQRQIPSEKDRQTQGKWQAERKQLLRLLKDKDLKIYQLIREIDELSKRKAPL